MGTHRRFERGSHIDTLAFGAGDWFASATACQVARPLHGTGADVYELTEGHVRAAGHFWIVPPHRHKIGRKTGKPLIIPLSIPAVQVIKDQERFQNSDVGVPSKFVFAHGLVLTWDESSPNPCPPHLRREAKPMGEQGVKAVFNQAIDRPGLTVYGFRGSFCTWAYEQMKYHPDAIEMTMGHERRIIMTSQGPRRDKTREAYDFAELIPERRRLLEDWGAFCTSPMPVPSGVVDISLAERRRLKNA
jgi:hypothetical protein